jgi:hypothetical protein
LLLLGTAAKVAFAESVDGRQIGNGQPGPICRLARQAFEEVLEGKHSKSAEWLTSFCVARGDCHDQ